MIFPSSIVVERVYSSLILIQIETDILLIISKPPSNLNYNRKGDDLKKGIHFGGTTNAVGQALILSIHLRIINFTQRAAPFMDRCLGVQAPIFPP